MQIDIEVSEAHANALTNLLKKPNGDIADMGPIQFEVIKPLAGVFGDEEGKWTVRLKTSLATAAQIATIVGLIWAHVPTKPEIVPQPPPNPITITLTTGKSIMHYEARDASDSKVLEAAIADYIAKNGPPDKVHVKQTKDHGHKK